MTGDINLRETTSIYGINLNRELTFQEEDETIIELAKRTTAFTSGTSLSPYSPSTAYSGIVYVEYDNKIYKHISTGPDTGVTPGTDTDTWIEVSAAELLHAQNTDTFLAVGTANQVTAYDAALLINNQFIAITLNSFNIQFVANILFLNRCYVITDTALTLIIHHAGYKSMFAKGLVEIKAPNVAERWQSATDLGTTALAVSVPRTYNNDVYLHITALNSDTPPDSDTTNWQIISQGTYPAIDSHYRFKFFEIELVYIAGVFSFTENKVRDIQQNNTYSARQLIDRSFLDGANISYNNAINNSTIALRNFVGSCQKLVADNSTVTVDKGTGTIFNCSLKNSSLTVVGKLNGSVDGLIATNVSLVFPGGYNSGKQFTGNLITGKSPANVPVDYRVRANADVTDAVITPEGSNIQDTLIAVASLDLAANGFSDLVGEYLIATISPTPITTILNFNNYFPVKIIPDGAIITLTTVAAASASGFNQLVSSLSAGSHTLDPAKGEYAVLKTYVSANSFGCIYVEFFKTS